jgi:hypothetical protein
MRADLGIWFDQQKRLLPVVVSGRVAVMLVVEVSLLFILLMVVLLSGAQPTSAVKSLLVFPVMMLIVLCGLDTVSTLRENGELELVVALAQPGLALFYRLIPVLALAVVQVLVVSCVLCIFLRPWQAIIGLVYSILPATLAATVTFYWNLRLRGPGAVFFASLATLAPALGVIGNAMLFLERSTYDVGLMKIVFSAVRSQIVVLLFTLALLALIQRQLDRTEELLNE